MELLQSYDAVDSEGGAAAGGETSTAVPVTVGHAAPRLLSARVSAAPPVGLAAASLAHYSADAAGNTVSASRGPGGVATSTSAALVQYGVGAGNSTAMVAYGAGDVSPAVTALRQALSTGVLTSNLKADQLWAPTAGPTNPYAARLLPTDMNHTVVGALQHEATDASAFEAQFNSFNSRGIAVDPSSGGMISNAFAPAARAAAAGGAGRGKGTSGSGGGGGASAAEAPPAYTWAPAAGVGGSVGKMPAGMSISIVKRRREQGGTADDVDGYRGPWAGYEGEQALKVSVLAKGELTDAQKKLRIDQGYHADRPGRLKDTIAAGGDPSAAPPAASADSWRTASKAPTVAKSGTAALIEEGKRPEHAGGGSAAQRAEADAAAAATAAHNSEIEALEAEALRRLKGDVVDDAVEAGTGTSAVGDAAGKGATSIFHGKEERDYQGRSWLAPPKGVRPDGGSHECYVPKKEFHKFTGHNKGVQSIQFFPQYGHMLLSGALDSKIKIWDVHGTNRPVKRTYLGHTGAVRQVNFNNDGARFLSCSYDRHVKVWDTETGAALLDVSNGRVPYCGTWYPLDNNVFLVGNANKKLMQYDMRTGEVVLEYNYHLGAVNTITFIDEARRIVSTSDDKKVLVWEYNAPVPIKYIADPSMQSMPAVAMHPDGESLVGQSMDNSLVVYFTGERVGLNRKKVFKGHVTAGFACQPAFSPNGAYLASGDGVGGLWFWEWKSGKMFRKLSNAHQNGPSICVAWHPLEPSWVASAGWGDNGTIKLWK